MKRIFLVAVMFVGLLPFANAQNFTLASQPFTDDSPSWMVGDDVNGDGKADIVALSAGGTFTVITNTGDGSSFFNTASSIPMSRFIQSFIVTDVNGDSRKDLVTANPNVNTVSLLTNSGAGHFTVATNLPVGDNPRSVVAADFGRGIVDIVSADYLAHTLTLLTNKGSGVFGSNTVYGLAGSPQTLVTGDVNGDGKLDLIVGVQNYIGVTVLTNKGNGTFATANTYYLGDIFPYHVVGADVNGDHTVDILVADDLYSEVFVLTNNGTGQFTIVSTNQAQNGSSGFAAFDANNDGATDFVFSSFQTNKIQMFTNNGAGVFSVGPEITVPRQSYFLAPADFNQDNLTDFVSGEVNFQMSVMTNSIPILPPMLRIRTTSTNFAVLAWPLASAGYVLQQNTNLSTTNWVTVPNAVDNSTGTNQVVLPKQPGNLFFRLKK